MRSSWVARRRHRLLSAQYWERLLKKYWADINTTQYRQVLANTQYPNTGIVWTLITATFVPVARSCDCDVCVFCSSRPLLGKASSMILVTLLSTLWQVEGVWHAYDELTMWRVGHVMNWPYDELTASPDKLRDNSRDIESAQNQKSTESETVKLLQYRCCTLSHQTYTAFEQFISEFQGIQI